MNLSAASRYECIERAARSALLKALAALGIVSSALFSIVASATTTLVPYDKYVVPVRKIVITGQVTATGSGSPGSITVTMTPLGRSPVTQVISGNASFKFTANQAKQYTLGVSSSPASGTTCTWSATSRTILLGSNDNVTGQDFSVTCNVAAGNQPPTITPVGSTAPATFPGIVVPVTVQVTDPEGAPLTVTFFDETRNISLGSQSIAGSGVASVQYSSAASGVYRVRASVSDGIAPAQSQYFTVAVLEKPNATAVIPASKPTSTIGAIGASFAVSDSGAATYSVPIAVPPGPAGMQPSVSLNYSSQAGAGAAGFGWSIGGSSTIARCPKTMATDGVKEGVNYDADGNNDAFCLDGQRLIQVATATVPSVNCEPTVSTTRIEYRTEIESYSRIYAYQTMPCIVAGPSRFEVFTKSGQVMIYGLADNAPNGSFNDGVGNNGVWVFSRAAESTVRPNSVKAWPLVRAFDAAGNFMQYRYCGTNLMYVYINPSTGNPDTIAVQDTCGNPLAPVGTMGAAAGFMTAEGAFPPTEHHLRAIDYGGYADGNRKTLSAPYARVEFTYLERPATDQIRAFDSGGGETTLTKRLATISTVSESMPAITYRLAVDSTSPAGNLSTGRMRLISLQQCAGNSTETCLPATTFDYSKGAFIQANGASSFRNGYGVSGNRSDINVAGDLDGDGKSDLLYAQDGAAGIRVALSSESAPFSVWRDLAIYKYNDVGAIVSFTVPSPSQKWLADFNGDGKADLIILEQNGSFTFCDLRLTPNVFATPSTPTALCRAKQLQAGPQGEYPLFWQGDFNGDGNIDILTPAGSILDPDNGVRSYQFRLYLGDKNQGIVEQTGLVKLSIPITATTVQNELTSFTKFAIGDFNGDGRADVIIRKVADGQCDDSKRVEPNPGDCQINKDLMAWNVCFSQQVAGTTQFACAGEVWGGNGTIERSATMDFNGDGIADMAFPSYPSGNAPAGEEAKWTICLSAGDGSFATRTAPVYDHGYLAPSLCKGTSIFAGGTTDVVYGDFDGDGKTDMAKVISGSTWRVCFSRTEPASTPVSSNNVVFQCMDVENAFGTGGSVSNILTGDFDGDGKTDILAFNGAVTGNPIMKLAPGPVAQDAADANTPSLPDQLVKITNGLGATISIKHAPLTNGPYERGSPGIGANELLIQSPLYVVKTVDSSAHISGPGAQSFTEDHSYVGLKGATNGRGLLGFAQRSVTDLSGLKRITNYNQDVATWWKARRPSSTETWTTGSGARKVSETTMEYALSSQGPVYSVHLTKSREKKVDADGSPIGCTEQSIVDANGSPKVDGYGNLLEQTQKFYRASSGDCDQYAEYVKVVTNTYEEPKTDAPANPSEGRWIIGRLKAATVSHAKAGVDSITRRSAFTYNGFSGATCPGPVGHMCSETVEPTSATGDSSLQLVTSYEYDSRGNTSAVIRSYDTKSNVRSTTQYDVKGRFPSDISNAKSHRETRLYDPRFGTIKSSKRYLDASNYRVTENTIDDFGRVVGETVTAADGSRIAETDVTWASDYNTYPSSRYSVTHTGHAGARTQIFYDALQREVASLTRSFGGGTDARSMTIYDVLGRVLYARRPNASMANGGDVIETHFAYDALGRQIQADSMGQVRVGQSDTDTRNTAILTSYHGLTTVTWEADPTASHKRITRKDAQGHVVSVTDCLGGVASPNDQAVCDGDGKEVVTAYEYDAVGNVTKVTTPDGLIRTATYDARGRKKSESDPDSGSATYTYSGAGELRTKSYAQGSATITVTTTYDELGRPVEQSGPSFSATWGYDDCGTGRVDGAQCKSTMTTSDQPAITERFTYFDTYGRSYRTTLGTGVTSVNDVQSTYTLTESQGRTSQVVHPTMQGFVYGYTSPSGQLSSISDLKNPAIKYWDGVTRYLDGHLATMSLGPVKVEYKYNGMGMPSSVKAGVGSADGSLQNATYGWDARNVNLTSRVDTPNGITSTTFGYDTLNRLISNGGLPATTYGDGGNFTSREGQAYTYWTNTNRVKSVAGGPDYSYDGVGNVIGIGTTKTITWKSFNMPASISLNGTQQLSWTYDAARSRVKESSAATGTTTYFPGMDRIVSSDGTRYRHYIVTPDGPVGVLEQFEATSGAVQVGVRYWLRDHLGSVVAELDGAGARTATFGFKAWGDRTTPIGALPSRTQQGFTGHEMLDEVGLVHMNGRIYDPVAARFLSADPIVQAPVNGQSFNRYSYVMNSPLSASDPSGHSSAWVQWRRPIAAIAITAVTYGLASEYVTYALAAMAEGGAPIMVGGSVFATESAIVTAGGFAAGGISGGNFESAVQGAFFAGVNFAIGQHLGGLANIAAHAATGCAQQTSAGGSCRSGALAGGFSAAAGSMPVIQEAGLAGAVVIGAVASKLSGDSAQNGALTAAFDYLLNLCLSTSTPCLTAWFSNGGKIALGTLGVLGSGAACATGLGCALGAPSMLLSVANVSEGINWIASGDEKTAGYNFIKEGIKGGLGLSSHQIDVGYSLAEVASAGALMKAPAAIYEFTWTPQAIRISTDYPLWRPLGATAAARGEAAGAVWDAWSAANDSRKR